MNTAEAIGKAAHLYDGSPAVSRTWYYRYKRPRRMGWPSISWRDAWNRGTPERPKPPHTVNPLEIAVRVRQSPGEAPVASQVQMKGTWVDTRPPGQRTGVRRVSTDWIGLKLPGQEVPTRARTDAPDWVLDLVADALARAGAEVE